MNGKSIQDILRQQALQRQAEIQRQQAQERAINEQREQQRQEWLRRNRIFENVSNTTTSSSSAAGGGSLKSTKSNGLKLVWDDILNVPVMDPNSVSDWNDFFVGSYFSNVIVSGNTVTLIPNGTLGIVANLFSPGKSGNQNLIEIIDEVNCVTSVGDQAFANSHGLITAILPASTYLGFAAFEYCQNLATVDFTSVQQLDELALGDLYSLGTLNLPALVTAGQYAFYYSTGLVSISAPNLVSIGDWGFSYCYNLINLSIPSCTSLGTSTANNNVFNSIGSIVKNNFTLTIDPSRLTCDGGNPDGDILTLSNEITPAILTVNGTPV